MTEEEKVGGEKWWEEWEKEELKRWKDIYPQMNDKEIRIQINDIGKNRLGKFNELKETWLGIPDEDIWMQVEIDQRRGNVGKRISKFLFDGDISEITNETINKLTGQLVDILEDDKKALNKYRQYLVGNYKGNIGACEWWEKELKKKENSTDGEKMQAQGLKTLQNLLYEKLISKVDGEEMFKQTNHNDLVGQMVMIKNSRGMEKNTQKMEQVLQEMKKNSNPLRQFRWIAGAGIFSGLAVGFVLRDSSSLKESKIFWIVFVVFFLSFLFEVPIKRWGRGVWKKIFGSG